MTAFVVAIALCYVLIKIPFWILGSVKISQGRSVLGSMAKAFVAYKTAGLVGAGAKKALGAVASRRVPHSAGRSWTRQAPAEQTTWDADGQGLLPLPGVRASSQGPGARDSESAGSSRSSGETKHGRDQAAHPRRGQGRQGALLTQQGAIKPLPRDTRRPPHPGVPREARPGEQTVLPVFAGHEPDRSPRESVHDELSRPRPTAPQPSEPEQPALFTTDRRLRAHARPPKLQPGDVPRSRPGEQMALNMPLRLNNEQAQRRANHLAQPPTPTQQDSAVSSAGPPRVKGQQPLLRQDGSINPRARARISTQARHRARQQARDQQRRRVQSAPPPVQFEPPPPPPASRRLGRTAPAPETPGANAPARRRRSTRLNTPGRNPPRNDTEAPE